MTRIEPKSPYLLTLTDPYSPASIRLKLKLDLDDYDYVFLSLQVKGIDAVEKRYKRAFREAIFEAASRALDDLAQNDFDPDDFDFQNLIVNHAIDAMKAGMKRPKPVPIRLARPSLASIFQMWDKWRAGKISARQKKNAKDIKQTFLNAVQQFWKKHSEDFRRGDVYDMQGVKDAFHKRAKIPIARADTIVQTEGTRFFNESIKTIYDEADGVTHWFMAAIRDARTTKWCKTRDGLVYRKDKYYDDLPPPLHWNCRTQILPLSISNPKHRKIIEDKRRWRENHSCEPLPRGWKT